MSKKNPCNDCPGGPDCPACINSPVNTVPVKFYGPKAGARAMLAGKTLKRASRGECFWGENKGKITFWVKYDEDLMFPLQDFSGLYEELA